MRYLRPIPRRLLPDDMLVWPSDGKGGFLATRMVRHVRLEWGQDAADDSHRSADAGRGRVLRGIQEEPSEAYPEEGDALRYSTD